MSTSVLRDGNPFRLANVASFAVASARLTSTTEPFAPVLTSAPWALSAFRVAASSVFGSAEAPVAIGTAGFAERSSAEGFWDDADGLVDELGLCDSHPPAANSAMASRPPATLCVTIDRGAVAANSRGKETRKKTVRVLLSGGQNGEASG